MSFSKVEAPAGTDPSGGESPQSARSASPGRALATSTVASSRGLRGGAPQGRGVGRRFEGRTAVVTGAAQGIGRACAQRLAEEGAAVVCADLQSDETTVRQITDKGGRAVHHRMDVRRMDDWDALVGRTLEEFGAVDLLGNVAGVVNTVSEDTVLGLTEEGWDHVIDTDLKGVWLGIPALDDRARWGGGIVNIASLAALRGLPNLAAYSAAKGGVVGLTQQAAVEYAAHNVTVNAIAPGHHRHPDSRRHHRGDARGERRAHVIGRLGRPEEIAARMAHFFSADGDFLTGLTYPVDGGWSIKGNF